MKSISTLARRWSCCARLMHLSMSSPTYPRSGSGWGLVGDCHLKSRRAPSMASELSSSNEYRNTSPCWPAVDDTLRQRLSALHHSLGKDIVDPATAADDFSHVVGELLLEMGIISLRLSSNGPHRPRPIETTSRNLSRTRAATAFGRFLSSD